MDKKEKALLWLDLQREALRHNEEVHSTNSNITLSLLICFSGLYFGLTQLTVNFQVMNTLQKEVMILLTALFLIIVAAILIDHYKHWRINSFGIRYAQKQVNDVLRSLKIVGKK